MTSDALKWSDGRLAPGRENILLTSVSSSWAGFPLTCIRSAAASRAPGYQFEHPWLAVVVRGACATTLHAGSRRRSLAFSPGSFAAYPPGCHWDAMRHEGVVDSICLSLDWPQTGGVLCVPEEARPRPALAHPCESDPVLAQLARSMAHEIQLGCPTGRVYAESLSLALGARLASLTPRRPGVKHVKLSSGKASRLVELIDTSLDTDLSIHRLAREVGLSSSHFAGCFAATFDQTVHQFVLSRRIRKAIELLDRGTVPQAEVALQCGFASQSHFSLVFKRRVGVSPSHYRRE